MFKFCLTTLICFIFVSVNGRIHRLKLHDDNREQITFSTYGFLKNGLLQVNVRNLEYNPIFKLNSIRDQFAFILEKTNNNGFSSFTSNDKKEDYCAKIRERAQKKNILQDKGSLPIDRSRFFNDFKINKKGEHTYSLIVFHLDLIEKNIELVRIGPDLKNLRIGSQFYGKFGYGLKQGEKVKQTTGAKNSKSFSKKNVSAMNSTNKNKNDEDENYNSLLNSDKFDNSAVINEFIEDRGVLKNIGFNITNSSLSFKFEMTVNSPSEEGLYILSFFNCFQPTKDDLVLKKTKATQSTVKTSLDDRNYFFEYNSNNNIKFGVNLDIDIFERNEDSFLSAGNIPEPTLYLTWSIIYFLAGISWMYILKASKNEVFKIHYLMMALVFVKSITLTFHAINMHYIAINGTQEAIWAILYYITYVLRGLLLIISILLVGTGFSVIKHILSENERRLFLIVIPLQTLATIAYIFIEEKEQGNPDYITWRQIFFVLDLFCCGAILFPVVWSIRHLEAASRTQGKMLFNLKKLKIFKHFYIMIIFYVYFTRIIGFLLKQMLPFRYEWFDELSMEVFTFTFFALTGYMFQPTSNNAYLRVGQEDLDMEEIEQMLIENEPEKTMDENTMAVLDLIEQDYYVSGLGSEDEVQLQPSGPGTRNPTLSSRNKNFTNDE